LSQFIHSVVGADPVLSGQSLVDVLRGSVHIYLAGTSGLLVLLLDLFSWRQRSCDLRNNGVSNATGFSGFTSRFGVLAQA